MTRLSLPNVSTSSPTLLRCVTKKYTPSKMEEPFSSLNCGGALLISVRPRASKTFALTCSPPIRMPSQSWTVLRSCNLRISVSLKRAMLKNILLVPVTLGVTPQSLLLFFVALLVLESWLWLRTSRTRDIRATFVSEKLTNSSWKRPSMSPSDLCISSTILFILFAVMSSSTKESSCVTRFFVTPTNSRFLTLFRTWIRSSLPASTLSSSLTNGRRSLHPTLLVSSTM
mmetsp:Transcript_12915/g.28308  ORF Transcript_12915/g.28308 Transcript_12915/m.28308 type:complete len:228 (+) Transcript_12915:1001-1684(+)